MKPSLEKIEKFLLSVNYDFPIPLSEKQDIKELARKFYEKATLFAHYVNGEIIAMIAGYTDNVTENCAYISVLATLHEARGRGLAQNLLSQFVDCARERGLSAVHLYAVPTNDSAMHVYRKYGFVDLKQENEPRPDDAHLIYYIKED